MASNTTKSRAVKSNGIKPCGRFSPEQVQQFLEAGNIQTMEDVQNALKDLFGQTLQAMLEGELDSHLGYPKNDTDTRQERALTNRRNGHTSKNVRSDYGDIALSVPRDREGSFEPLIVQKRQKNVTGIEDQILALYTKGVSTRDIQDHLQRLYGIEVSPTFISDVTDKVLPQIRTWQSRPLAPVYALMFLDAIHFKVRHEGRIVSKAAYVIIGVDLEGMKEVLGIWIGEAESAKFWLGVLTEIKNRGCQDLLICCIDNLSGFSEAIGAVFPLAQVQKCIVHQMRNSLRYVSSRDRQSVVNALRLVYTAPSEQSGLVALEEFASAWGERYPLVVSSWRSGWSELSTFFGFSVELRRLMYTTNIIESFHRQLRKVTRGKALFPTDDSLLKLLYLVSEDVQRHWTYRIPHWGQILSQLSIVYGERVKLAG
jgi:putative transposase